MQRAAKKYLWEKKTDTELQLWPKSSTEHYLASPTLPKHLVMRRKFAKISAPEPLPFNILEARGILNAAVTEHNRAYYQARADEKFAIALFITGGSPTLRLGRREHKLKRGSVFLAPPSCEYVLKSSDRWTNFWFHIEDSKVWRGILGKEIIIKKSSRIEDLRSAVNSYLREVYKPDRSLELLDAYANAIVILLKSEFSPNVGDAKTLEAFLSGLKVSHAEKTSAAKTAKRMGLSVYNLDKLCLKTRGTKFAKLAKEARMENAKRILISPEGGVAKAAKICGYADRSSFSKAFKKKFLISPSDFAEGENAQNQ